MMQDPIQGDGYSKFQLEYPNDHPLFSGSSGDNGISDDLLWQGLLDDMGKIKSNKQHTSNEQMSTNYLWGEHKITGGADEGEQWLDSNPFPVHKLPKPKPNKLPAYCDPPNPCPIGMNPQEAASPCDLDIPDTKEFNQQWILDKMMSGECSCDREHMRNCDEIDHKSTRSSKKVVVYYKINLIVIFRLLTLFFNLKNLIRLRRKQVQDIRIHY